MKQLKQLYSLKPLRWLPVIGAESEWVAYSPGWNYLLRLKLNGYYYLRLYHQITERFLSFGQAKRAANKDYQIRILPYLKAFEDPEQDLRSDRQLDRIIAEWRWGRIPYSGTSVEDTGPVYPAVCTNPVACEEAEAKMTDEERVHFVSMITGDTPRHRAEALVKVIERYRKKERVWA